MDSLTEEQSGLNQRRSVSERDWVKLKPIEDQLAVVCWTSSSQSFKFYLHWFQISQTVMAETSYLIHLATACSSGSGNNQPSAVTHSCFCQDLEQTVPHLLLIQTQTENSKFVCAAFQSFKVAGVTFQVLGKNLPLTNGKLGDSLKRSRWIFTFAETQTHF